MRLVLAGLRAAPTAAGSTSHPRRDATKLWQLGRADQIGSDCLVRAAGFEPPSNYVSMRAGATLLAALTKRHKEEARKSRATAEALARSKQAAQTRA